MDLSSTVSEGRLLHKKWRTQSRQVEASKPGHNSSMQIQIETCSSFMDLFWPDRTTTQQTTGSERKALHYNRWVRQFEGLYRSIEVDQSCCRGMTLSSNNGFPCVTHLHTHTLIVPGPDWDTNRSICIRPLLVWHSVHFTKMLFVIVLVDCYSLGCECWRLCSTFQIKIP